MLTPKVNKHGQTGKGRVSVLVLLATVVTVLIFARLGFWQLSRANEKIELVKASQDASTQPALEVLEEIDSNIIYRTVELSGRFDFEHQFLRDNMVFEKQPGFEVLTPFVFGDVPETGSSRAILVNRGWVPLGTDRQRRPDVSRGSDLAVPHSLRGVLVQPSKGFTLGEAIDPSENSWPLVVQYLDYETLAARLDTIPLLPAVVVLDEGHPQSFSYSWRPVADGPEKHYGYAFQWFAMLIAVVVLFIYLNFFKKDEPDRA